MEAFPVLSLSKVACESCMQTAPPPARPGSAPLLPKVMRQRLHDAVVDHIRSLIVEGKLVAGQKMNERELCEVFGISRTPLREAMKRKVSTIYSEPGSEPQ